MGDIITIALLPLGFFFLVKGADYLVEGASSVAKRFNISNIMIGLTIVALGTSLPELLVNIFASVQGATDLAIGNVIGSNISNIALILGICAIIYPLSITKGTVWKEIPLNLMAVFALFVMANDGLIDGSASSVLSRADGIILMFFFIIFLYYSFGIAKQSGVMEEVSQEKELESKAMDVLSVRKSILLIVLGTAALPIGAQLIINGSLTLGEMLGFSQSFLGLTLLALGTSAPELATSVMATYKKNADLAIGNVVGSNLFNIFWVLGLSAVIRPLPLNTTLNADILICAVITLLLFLFIAIKNQEEKWWFFHVQRDNHVLSRTEGLVFVMLYVAYMVFLVWRG